MELSEVRPVHSIKVTYLVNGYARVDLQWWNTSLQIYSPRSIIVRRSYIQKMSWIPFTIRQALLRGTEQ